MRLTRLLQCVVAVALLCTGVAVAANLATADYVDEGGAIRGCVAKSGALHVVPASEECRQHQTSLVWNQTRGFRMLRATPDEVEITAVGSGPIGFPTPEAPPTEVLQLELPQGVYQLTASVAARKAIGNGDLLCWALQAGRAHIFTRASLGTDPGHAMRATVGGSGFASIPAGGDTVTLACWQASNDAAGSPSGERPHVFFASLSATSVTRATLRRYGSGTVTEIP
jgi:hypothetical protein